MAMTAISHLRDASFSSYLDTADTDFVMHGSSPVFTPSRKSSSPSVSPSPMIKRRTRGPLGELGVFGAEGYFTEKADRHMNGVEEDKVAQTKLKTKARNPSTRSESSWSSKSGSFVPRQTSRNMDQMKPKKSLGRTSWFQCKGSCYDVKAPVNAVSQAPADQRKGFWEDQVVQINSKKLQERVLSSFAFPNHEHAPEEDPRKSIEVFGLRNIMTRKEEEYTMDRKLSMQSWDAIPVTPQDDRRSMDSDASSDLFDIAVFPAEMSPVTAAYAPSEASIEWSVVTASAAEFSTKSEYDEEINKLKPKPKEVHRSSANGGILGCRGDKAIKAIAPAAPRMATYPPIPPKKTQTFAPSLNDCQLFSPANTSFASKGATATTTTITAFSSSPTTTTRAPRAIYM